MKFSHVILLTIGLLFLASCRTGGLDDSGAGDSSVKKVEEWTLGSKVRKEHVSSIVDTFETINAYLPSQMEEPVIKMVVLRRQGQAFNYQWDTGELTISYQAELVEPGTTTLDSEIVSLLDPDHTRSIIAHEYGHTVIRRNIQVLAKQFDSALLKLMVKLQDPNRLDESPEEEAERLKRQQEIGEEKRSVMLEITGDPGRPKEETEALMTKYQKLSEEFDSLMTSVAGKTHQEFNSYDEFFADLVAVLYRDDLDAIYVALSDGKVDSPKKSLRTRSYDPTKIQTIAAGDYTPRFFQEEYFLARGYLGQQTLKRGIEDGLTSKQKGEIIFKTLVSIIVAGEKRVRLAPKNDRISKREFRINNEEFQKAIECVFKYGINEMKMAFDRCWPAI